MSSPMDEDHWRGTSDTRAVIHARAATTPAQRLQWLEESLLLAEASGALALDRARRQRLADRWAASSPVDLTRPCPYSGQGDPPRHTPDHPGRPADDAR